ncbi:class I tRNA ligase family protein [Fictibacillus sp. KIGAM418]|uniref:Class I tRNA ligase family protein n=1 Tax=Fictibacillus marinisediminis TaxID=2878389 RepID=A0A9X1XK10_9BACL|nr:class I tRNA ligase family protein [Fictibacillus marinisediminis]MCK6258989.1 class I tRNA ligase family protein [Fictibacillus marinisediminis]
MENNVLILPMQPTPNGRMHIGHGSGTYLRADVLARALRIQGHQVKIISGSDAFENWVLAEAKQSGKTPHETCDFYHTAIQEDLNNLDIHFDAWIDPRSPEHFPGYLETHEEILNQLQKSGYANLEDERVPFSKETGQALMGTWISGRCPQCKEPCGGSSCVYCGAHFQPEELIEPKSRLDESTLEWRTVQNWFARPTDILKILNHLESTGVQAHWMKAAEEYLTQRGGRIRLSGPGSWGIKTDVLPEGFLLSNPYYQYSVYCGDVFKRLTGAEIHPFHPESKVTTIGIFGNDNSTPGLVAPHVIAQGSGGHLKPFDTTIVNGMLFLEGQKCSTSKKHGIWLADVQENNTGISSDELRYFLAQAPLDKGSADIRLEAMVDSIMSFREWYSEKLIPAFSLLNKNQFILFNMTDKLERALAEQKQWLTPQQLDLPSAVTVLKDWMYNDTEETEEWLLGIILLGAPIIPKLSHQLWNLMGLDGTPAIEVIKHIELQPQDLNKDMLTLRPEISVDSLKPFIHLAAVHS